MVCPSMLHRNVFTTGDIDNIDHNCTSTTPHGTSISIFQHPSTPTIKLDSFKIDNSNEFHRSRYCLPTSYTDTKPTKGGRPVPPSNKTISETSSTLPIHQDASAWVSELATISNVPAEHRISFSAFYSKETITDQCNSVSKLLPLLEESVNSPAMIRHCMEIIFKITNKVNPSHTSVITGDQPVYAIGKQVQWTFPLQFKNIFWMTFTYGNDNSKLYW